MVKKGCITAERRQAAARRLRAVGGQVKGLEKMIKQDRYCLDILTQLSAAQEALRKVGKIILRNYLEVCVTKAICAKRSKAIYNELMDVVYKYAK